MSKAIELLQNKKIEAIEREDSYYGEIRLTLVEVGQILAELTDKPLCKTCGESGKCPNCLGSGKKTSCGFDGQGEHTLDCIKCRGIGICPDCPPKSQEAKPSESTALVMVLKMYSKTPDFVSQRFYQGLCIKAATIIEQLQTKLKELDKNGH